MVSLCPCVAHDRRECVANWCYALVGVGIILGIIVGTPLVMTYGNHGVRVSVEDASLTTFTLATPPMANSAPTTAAATYNLSMSVRVRNPNRYRVRFAAPLEARLRFDGAVFGPHVWLAGQGEKLPARYSKVWRLVVGAVGETMPGLGVDGVAEFARQSSAGVFEVDVQVAGRYTMRGAKHNLAATCALKLPLGAPSASSSRKVMCV